MDEQIEQRAAEIRREYNRDRARAYRERNREAYNASQRKWRKENPDKVREHQERYWRRKAERELARSEK